MFSKQKLNKQKIDAVESFLCKKAQSSQLRFLLSACLVGENCRYDGTSKMQQQAWDAQSFSGAYPQLLKIELICPELLGGLVVPRAPAELQSQAKHVTVINSLGCDVTKEYLRGAQRSLELAKEFKADLCVLKSKSPSCSCYQVYDGSFSKTLIPGQGVSAALLQKAGFICIDEGDFSLLWPELKKILLR